MELKRHGRPLIALSAVLAIALLAAACGGTSSGAVNTTAASPAPAGGSTGVSIANYAFAPQTLTVKPGTTVTWTNNDSVPHNVVSTNDASTSASTTGTFSSGNLTKGQTFSFTFDKAGTYYYECSIHAAMAGMHGTVVVQ